MTVAAGAADADRRAEPAWPGQLALVTVSIVTGTLAWVLTVLAYLVLVFDSYGDLSGRLLGFAAFVVAAAAIWYVVGLGAGAVASALGDPPRALAAVLTPALVPFALWYVGAMRGALSQTIVPLAFVAALGAGIWLGMRHGRALAARRQRAIIAP